MEYGIHFSYSNAIPDCRVIANIPSDCKVYFTSMCFSSKPSSVFDRRTLLLPRQRGSSVARVLAAVDADSVHRVVPGLAARPLLLKFSHGTLVRST